MDTQQRWFECSECNYKNRNTFNLKYHAYCHTRNLKIKCPLCSFSAKAKIYVVRHLKSHHLNLTDDTTSNLEYLKEIDYVITTLLEINEKELESNVDGPTSVVINEDLNGKSAEKPGKDVFSYKCTLCKYFTDNPANGEVHKKAHNQENGSAFKCTLCNYSSNLKFVVIRHMNRDHHYSNDSSSSIGHHHRPESYLKAKGMDMDTKRFELLDLTDDGDEIRPKKNIIRSCPLEHFELHQQEHSMRLERRKVEIEEAECRKRISQRKEEIRLARISMTEMRVRVKKRKEILSEKRKQKEKLSHCLELIRINNQKVNYLSMSSEKLEIIRTRIKDTNRKKLHSELKLRETQLEVLKSKRDIYELEDDIVIFKLHPEEAIKDLKNHVKELKNQLESLRLEEKMLTRDVEQPSQSLQEVMKITDHVLEGLQLEIEEIEKGIKLSLQDEVEDVFNQLVISTEDKIRNLSELKNNLLDILFLKRSIRRISDRFIECHAQC